MKKTLLVLLLVFIAIQLVPVDRTNMPVDKTQNFVDIQKPPQEVEKIIKNACYDCHSNETVYPDYAFVAPFSWAIKDHINEGREGSQKKGCGCGFFKDLANVRRQAQRIGNRGAI